jgi:uncharacterized LabA/DUF88 family protein
MSINQNKNRTKIYIDGANMLYTQKKMGWNIDWEKLKNFFGENWEVREIKYYTGVREDDEKMKSFLRYLNNLGFITVTKTLKVIKIGPDHPLYRIHHYREMHKSNFDVEMTTDVLTELLTGQDNPDRLKEIVIMSGDSDFKYLINVLRKYGIGVTVIASKTTLSWEMRFAASRLIKLEEIREKIEKQIS